MIIHGKSGTKIYKIWQKMRFRCYDPKSKSFENYGNRNIKVQKNWINDFVPFYKYVSELPNYDENNLGINGISIDRIDNDGNYEENNLRWATRRRFED